MSAFFIWIHHRFWQCRSIVHKRPVPFSRILSIECFFDQRKYVFVMYAVMIFKKMMNKNPSYVGLNEDRRFIECECRDRACGILSYPGKFREKNQVIRDYAAVFFRCSIRDIFECNCPPIISHP